MSISQDSFPPSLPFFEPSTLNITKKRAMSLLMIALGDQEKRKKASSEVNVIVDSGEGK